MAWWRHGVSALSFGVVALNLLVWMVPLLLLAGVKALTPRGRALARRPMETIYRLAVRVDDWWLRGVLGLRWPRPDLPIERNRSCVVLANHRTWMDVFIVQSVLTRKGPIVKFLAKRELAWIPVLGLICWAFDFPLLRRRAGDGMTENERRLEDRRRVQRACAVLEEAPGAMLSFAEGTRFTPEKHQGANPPYRHLLLPKPGGLSTICEAIGGPVIDLTLHYPVQASFWRMLGGGLPAPSLHAELVSAPEPDELRDWLETRWRSKDARIDAYLAESRQ